MTRINSAIPVENLTDEHLLAEHREIKRLPHCFIEAIKSGSIYRIPDKFTLGPGHVTFFLNKMAFCLDRYNKIYGECIARGFDVKNFAENWDGFENGPDYFQWYEPTAEERQLLIERISTRIRESNKPYWHYCGDMISQEEAINLLTR